MSVDPQFIPTNSEAASLKTVDDESKSFQQLDKKLDRFTLALCTKVRSVAYAIPEKLWHMLVHEVENIFGGLGIGVALWLLQFTPSANVNRLMSDNYEKFIHHYQELPLDVLNAAILFVAISLLISPAIGGVLRKFLLSPIIKATAHAMGITSGMILCLVFVELCKKGLEANVKAGLLAFALVTIFSLIFLTVAEVLTHGAFALFEKRIEPFEACKPRTSTESRVKLLVLFFLGALFAVCSWLQLEENGLNFAKKMNASVSAAPDAKGSHKPN